MKDRISQYPNRIGLTDSNGVKKIYTLSREDNPTEEGTKLNKANLLSDDTADLLGLDYSATVNDAFDFLSKSKFDIGDVKLTQKSSLSDDWLVCNGYPFSSTEYPILAEMVGINPKLDILPGNYSTSDSTQFSIATDGNTMATIRVYNNTIYTSYSTDNGQTWQTWTHGSFSSSSQVTISKLFYVNGYWCFVVGSTTSGYATRIWYLSNITSGGWSASTISASYMYCGYGNCQIAHNGKHFIVTFCDTYGTNQGYLMCWYSDTINGTWNRVNLDYIGTTFKFFIRNVKIIGNKMYFIGSTDHYYRRCIYSIPMNETPTTTNFEKFIDVEDVYAYKEFVDIQYTGSKYVALIKQWENGSGNRYWYIYESNSIEGLFTETNFKQISTSYYGVEASQGSLLQLGDSNTCVFACGTSQLNLVYGTYNSINDITVLTNSFQSGQSGNLTYLINYRNNLQFLISSNGGSNRIAYFLTIAPTVPNVEVDGVNAFIRAR